MSYASEVLADSPAAFYRCQEASGQLQDSSGNGRHTTATVGAGSCTYGVTSPITSDASAKAITLNTFAFSAPDVGLDLGDVLTLEAWVQLASIGDGVDGYVVSKSTGAYAMGVTEVGTTNAPFRLTRVGVAHIAESDVSISDTAWYHIVCTKNGATVKQYLDGVDVTDLTVSNSTMVDNTNLLYIGDRIGTGDAMFNHSLTEVAVYPTALTQTRVQAHYTAATLTTQTLLPDADLAAGGWVNELGSATPLYSKLADSSDSTYIAGTAS